MKLRISRALLPVKAVYFTHLAGLSSLVPYLPLFMGQLGLTATQIGLIRGLEPLLALVFTHLWGSIADSFNQHRAVLLTAIGGATVFLFGTFFVPASLPLGYSTLTNVTHRPSVQTQLVSLGPYRTTEPFQEASATTELPTYLYISTPSVHSWDKENKSMPRSQSIMCDSICAIFAEREVCNFSKSDTSSTITYQCSQPICFVQHDRRNNDEAKMCNGSESSDPSDCMYSDSICSECQPERYWITEDGQRMPSEDIVCSSNNRTPGSNAVLVNVSMDVSLDLLPSNRNFSCRCHDTDASLENQAPPGNSSELLSTFFLLLILVLFSRSFMCTTSPILHSTTMELLHQKHDDFGKQRIWGAFGWGAFSLISGVLIDYYNRKSADRFSHFDPAFYLFLGFMLASAVAASFIVFPPQTSVKAQCQNIPLLIRKPEILGFLVMVCVLGMGFGVIGTFLFLYLQELHASHTLMGLTLTITCIAEIPFLFLSNRVIRFTGHIGALCFSLFCYMVRFLGYSLITNAWAVIPFELLHGITYGLSWAACTSYANQNAPPGLALTLQAVFTSVHMGFGKGLGTLLGGLVYDRFGGRNLFRSAAFVVGLSGPLYLGLYHVFTKRHPLVLYSRFRSEEVGSRRNSRRESSAGDRGAQSIEMEAELVEEDPRPKLDASSMRLALRDINRPASPIDADAPGTSGMGRGYQQCAMEMLPHPAAFHGPVYAPPPRPPRDFMVRMPCGYYHKRRMDSLEDDDVMDGSPGATSLAALIQGEQGRPGLYGLDMVERERLMLHNIGVNMMSYLDDVDLDQAMDAV
ncbi:major facilitator superfamily domain-containing protein 6-like [Diadema antillarum]|uniref:major facilitator superfamily domain-containing protein 6-like n=1 Tax=Diadema antillarum TaxID=105358 RepID=UPI003A8C2949